MKFETRRFPAVTFLLLLTTTAGLLLGSGAQAKPQNVVLIFLDDVDLYDVGYNSVDGSAYNAKTPNIDALAAGGLTLKNFYAISPVCSPTRASLSTGMDPLQFGLDGIWHISYYPTVQNSRGLNGLPTDIARLGSEMNSLGLKTMFYGKWHVGQSRPEYLPGASGWDEYELITPISNAARTYWVHRESGITSEYIEHPDSWWTENIVSDINAKARAGEHFFIQFAPFSTHSPWIVPPDFDNAPHGFDLTTMRGKYQAILYTLDMNIARIVSALNDNELLNETLIIVTSDNGGESVTINPDRTAELTGVKRWLLEGGIHVPTFLNWPNGISPNTSNDTVMTTMDLLPTLMDLMGSPNLSTLDVTGTSKAKAIIEGGLITHKPILWETAWYWSRPPDETWEVNDMAMRRGDHKIIRLHGPLGWRLYDLATDPVEAVDLQSSNPELFTTMKNDLLQMRLDASQYKQFPKETNEQLVVGFDPRLNSHNNDLTFRFRIHIPDTLAESKNIYHHPDQLDAKLLTTGQIQIEFFSVLESTNSQISEVLLSDPLSPGVHEILFDIDSWLSDTSQYELYVDGVLVDTQDDDITHRTPWSSVSDATLGDVGLRLTCIGWYRLEFFPADFLHGSVSQCDPVIDDDSDAVADVHDNCTLVINPAQRDTDGDGFGNFCDADFDNNDAVNFADLSYMKSVFFTPDAEADLNGDGVVNFADLGLLKSMFFQPPGPSGVAP